MTSPPDQQRTAVVDRALQLSEMWDRLARSHTVIGAGCSCGVGGGVAVSLADYEQDIVDFLMADGLHHKRPDVVAMLETSARDGEAWSIARLLDGVARTHPDAIQAPVDPASAAFVLDRLAGTLQSFEKLHGG